MSDKGQKSGGEQRTELAADRNVFAAERTYAAWVRTGLTSLAAGVGARKLLDGTIPVWSIRLVASVLIVFSVFAFAAGVWRHFHPGVSKREGEAPELPPWVLIAANGFLAIVALTALVAIWFGDASGKGAV